MPHFVIRNIEEDKIKAVWNEVKADCMKLCECDEDWFTLELVETKQLTNGIPAFIIIEWFERSAVKAKLVEVITNAFKAKGINDLTIIFRAIDKANYFENGQSF